MSAGPPSMRAGLLIFAIGAMIIGSVGTFGAAVMLAPAWQAAHGGGHTGTFTLTDPGSCDRYQPPRQRCGWFGDFVTDDGTVVRRHMELAGGLPPGAKIGDTLPARDTGSWAQIYQATDTQGWKTFAAFLAAFSGAFLLGILLLEPWSWLGRLRQRRARTAR